MQKAQVNKNLILFLVLSVLMSEPIRAQTGDNVSIDDSRSSSNTALAWLDSVKGTAGSMHWPNVDPVLFFENLRGFAISPLKFYEGRSNNFCAYTALTYLPLNNDAAAFIQFMLKLYQDGEATYHKVHFQPEKAVLEEAGLLKYKGALDLNPAAQMWFLSLADHFKGYLNVINKHFDKGDENTLWASTNFAKFNRMVRKVGGLKVKARGSDLIRPWINDLYGYIREKLNNGTVYLYLNNRLLYRKKHTVSRFSIPTHYILLLDIYQVSDDKINIVYWDYGMKSLQQVSPQFLKKIIFGITFAYPHEQ